MSGLVLDGVLRPGSVATVFQPERIKRASLPATTPTWQPLISVKPMLDGVYRRQIEQIAETAAPAASPIAPTVSRLNPNTLSRWLSGAVALPMLAVSATSLVSYAATHRPTITHTPARTNARTEVSTIADSSPAPKVAVSPAPAPVIAAAPAAGSLDQLITGIAAKYGDRMSIIVTNLTTGETVSHNPDAIMTSASLYKLFVAAEVYHRIDLGQLSYSDAAGGGTGRNIRDCLQVMINISDNACGAALGNLVGWNNITSRAKVQGFSNTDLVAFPMHTTATDVSSLLKRLYEGTLLSPDSTAQFMALLKDQRVNNRLPVGLPAGTVIAHKTGDLFGYMHDAGIVYGPKATYLITAMGAPGSFPSQFSDLSSQVYNYFNK